MDILSKIASTKRNVSHGAMSLAIAAGLSLGTAAVAEAQTAMAPPLRTSPAQTTGVNAGADNIFNWQEIPANQEVPITHAAFDQGGYQLYDTVGETIVVPFTNQNLYVMKFAQSSNGKMYFVNDGDYPVLYVPANGFLDNATVGGARWYPFGEDFHPAQPVFLGIAPSWSAFSGMGWYPDMAYYGGYWGNTSFITGGVFLPSAGLYFAIGGRPYYGWSGYHHYIVVHPAPYHAAYYRPDFYRWANRPHTSFHPFGGADHPYYAHQAFVGAHHFDGESHFGGTHGPVGTHLFNGGHNVNGTPHFDGGHTFNGEHNSGGTHSFNGGHTFGGSHNGDEHTFGGSHNADGHSGGGHTFSGSHGGDHSFNSGHSVPQGAAPFPGAPRSGDHTFNGSHDFGGSHTFSGAQGGNAPAFNGAHSDGNHTFNGSQGGNQPTFGGAPRGGQGVSGAQGGNQRPVSERAHNSGGRHER